MTISNLITMESKIELFRNIKHLNPEAILTGSMALKIQGILLRNLPNDLDIHIPFGASEFVPMKEFSLKKTEVYFDGESINRKSFGYCLNDKDIKIDVFHPYKEKYIEPKVINCNGINCTHFIDILKFKMKHALNLANINSEKHSLDLIFIILNNTNLKNMPFNNFLEQFYTNRKGT